MSDPKIKSPTSPNEQQQQEQHWLYIDITST